MAQPRAERSIRSDWNWHPELPILNSPLFVWPLRPVAILRWFAKSWFALSMTIATLCTALVVWMFLQPPLEQSVSFEFDWIAQMYLRNLGIMILIAGSLHLYFHKFKKQGQKRKYLAQDFEKNHHRFTFGDQVLDNMFWTLASGVTIWTASLLSQQSQRMTV